MHLLLQNLKKRNINAYFVANKKEALNKALELIPPHASIGFGGSETLKQIGILDTLRKKDDVKLLDRTKTTTKEEKDNLQRQMFSADIFLSSSNAITELGQIVNVDGVGNRVAAITFGPKKVIIVTGKNKITPDLDSALHRIKTVCCPMNLKRLNNNWTKENIWGQISIIERQRDPERMHLIIVDEELGF